ncbi:MAG TPA: glycosyltransferase family 39 protein, partial [Herpetosiphonaceae bacterium]
MSVQAAMGRAADRSASASNESQGAAGWLGRLGDWPVALLWGLAALALRLHRLGAQSLWLDEGGSWHEATQRSWGFLLAELWSPRSGYPLYHLLLKGWVALFGDSEIALRLPSALAGALLVSAVYLLGARLHGRRLGGLAAALLLANPFALWQAQDAKTYSLVMLAAALSLLALWNALTLGGRRRWLAWIGLLALLLSLHRLALFAVIGQVAALVAAGGLERRTKL